MPSKKDDWLVKLCTLLCREKEANDDDDDEEEEDDDDS